MKENSLTFAKRLNERGLDYEEWCAQFLEAHGYAVRFSREHEIWDPDILLDNDIPMDVKGSTLHTLSHGKQGYSFLLHKVNRSKPIDEPVVALVCHDITKNFTHYLFVPTQLMRQRHYLAFYDANPLAAIRNSRKNREMEQYYQSFVALDALGITRDEQDQ